jgi:hypothetical protein
VDALSLQHPKMTQCNALHEMVFLCA